MSRARRRAADAAGGGGVSAGGRAGRQARGGEAEEETGDRRELQEGHPGSGQLHSTLHTLY